MVELAKRRYARARRYYARVKRHAKSMTVPIAPIAGILAAPSVQAAIAEVMVGNIPNAINNLGGIAGFKPSTHAFDVNYLKNNAIPMIAGVLVHKYIGGSLGVNRALGSAKVPLLRV